jgi:hypothetical protein
MKVGTPVPLDDLRAGETTPEAIAEATDRIMRAIVHLVADLRGETPPAELYDPSAHGQSSIGNPNKKKPKSA